MVMPYSMCCRELALDVLLARLGWMCSEKYYSAHKSLGVTLFIKFHFIFNANPSKASCVVRIARSESRASRRLSVTKFTHKHWHTAPSTPQITKRHQIFFARTHSLCGNVVESPPLLFLCARQRTETNRRRNEKKKIWNLLIMNNYIEFWIADGLINGLHSARCMSSAKTTINKDEKKKNREWCVILPGERRQRWRM